LAGPALAQNAWPSRAVTIVVPYGPGASNDTFTRAIAQVLARDLGQPFVVENVAGAGGYTGTDRVAKTEPDGYTFVEVPNSVVGFEPFMKVDLNPLEDLTPVAVFAKSPTAMVIPASVPATTVQEFIDYAKANPDTTFYGMAGIGTTQQQHGELFNSLTGLSIKPVNYKSSADAQTDLVAGRLHLMFVTVASALGQIESGQLRLLGYTNDQFPDTAPAAPTMAEAGVPGMESAQIFWGIFGPAGLPDDIRDKMNAAINQAVQDPGFIELAGKSGATPASGTAAEFIALLEAEAVAVNNFAAIMPAVE
jgi:tripartite-type tricarboxylate transporter receptor subunit TctC